MQITNKYYIESKSQSSDLPLLPRRKRYFMNCQSAIQALVSHDKLQHFSRQVVLIHFSDVTKPLIKIPYAFPGPGILMKPQEGREKLKIRSKFSNMLTASLLRTKSS